MAFTVFKVSINWWITPMILLVAASLTVSVTLHGAAITWGPATDIAGDSDVINSGAVAYAYDWGPEPSTVNGVSFTALTGAGGGANVVAPNFFDSGTSYFASGSDPFAALSSAYQTMLIGAVYIAGSSPVAVPVTLTHLAVGHNYSVQVWVNDPRGPENARNETITSPGGNTNTLKFSTNTLTNPGGPGQYTVGTFTADATNQTFTLTGDSVNDVTQMNAVQVRDLSAPPVWSGIHSAGAGAVNLIFTGPSGAHYTLLTTTNLTMPIANWTALPNGAGVFGAIPVTNLDSPATNHAQFYQIRSP